MRVAIVCPYDWSFHGGVRSHILGLSRALGKLGVEASIVAPSSDVSEQGILRVGGSVPIPANGSVARLCFSPYAVQRLKALFAGGDFDLMHLHEPAIPSVSLLALGISATPAVATFHASRSRSFGYALGRPLLARRLSRLRERIAVSTAAQALASRYFPGPYDIVPNGIDVSRYSQAEDDSDLRKLQPFVLFVGRDEPRKGFRVAVEAVAMARDQLPVNLVAVGPTGGSDGLPQWVHAMGPVPDGRLASIYRSADAFVAPSLGGESFGIVLVEAMAAGAPVVCSDLPGYREAASDAALFAPPGDAAATAARLLEVLRSKTVSDDLRRRGSRRAEDLDWGVLADQIVAIYRRAVS